MKFSKIISQVREQFEKEGLLSDILWVLVGIITALAIYNGLGLILSTEKPMVTVISYSMYPTLTRGDMLVLKGADPKDIAVGDIIVYNYPLKNKLIVHRVYRINADGTLKTKGDNNETNSQPDPWVVEPEWIIGKMIYRVPYLGYPRILIGDSIDKAFSII